MKTAFIHGRPGPHPSHGALASSVGAEWMFVDPILRWNDRPSTALRRYASWLLCALAFPQRESYDLFLTEGGHATPVVMRKLGLLHKWQRIAALMGNESLYFMKTRYYSNSTIKKMISLYSSYDALICTGEMQAELARTLITPVAPQVKIITTTSFVSAKRREQLGAMQPDLAGHNLLYLSNGPGGFRSWYKGIDLVFAAVQDVIEVIPAVTLSVVGEWDESVKKEMRAAYPKAAARVHWMGKLDDIGPVLANTSLKILLGRGDAYPNAVFECMCAGVPALVSEWTGSKEVVMDADPTMVVPLDPKAAASRIVQYIQSSTEAKQSLSDRCRRAVSHCTDTVAFQNFHKAIDLVMAGARRPSRP